MKYYEISYSIASGGSILIEAKSEDEAIDQFEAMAFDDLFDMKGFYKGVEIDDIEQIKDL